MKILDTGAMVYLNNDAIFREHEMAKKPKQAGITPLHHQPIIALHDGTTMAVGDTHLTLFNEEGRVIESRPYIGTEKQLINSVLALRKRFEGPTE